MDMRNARREKSRRAIEEAIERLTKGLGTHPRHVGLRNVRLSNSAVAREAGVGEATLYRFPDLCYRIAALRKERGPSAVRSSEQRRASLLSQIEELKRQVRAAISENARLARELAKYDPMLGLRKPASIETQRRKRSVK